MPRSAVIAKPKSEHALERGRKSLQQKAWGAAVVELTAADHEAPLDPLDLVELAQAALLVGKEAEGIEILTRAHQAFLNRDQAQPAARCAFWLGFQALLNGDQAQASGWLARAERLLDSQPDCVEKGYMLLPVGYRGTHEGEAAKAFEAFAEATRIGQKFEDPDLTALAVQGQGRALIRQGEIARGVSLLDEAMIAVTAGEVSPLTAGGVYCSVLDACGEIFDLRRAHEWTSALERWCASQPDVVPYQGPCMVRRAEIMQLHGEWQDAFEEATRACHKLCGPQPKPHVGAAYYRLAEIHRLRGEFANAESAYREAARSQQTAQPGLALLRLAQGQTEAAGTIIRRVTDEVRDLGSRARILDAHAEIMLAVKDFASARASANELAAIAQLYDAPQLHAMAARTDGAVLLAEGKTKDALILLRRAWEIWCELDAPYEAARTRMLMARACDELSDCDTANLELQLAREAFQKLGAMSDLALTEATRKSPADLPLTEREVEVLRLVASGKTNRAIAAKLGISEKTVARHISNIFNKLDLSSRAAATAFAYEHELIEGRT